MPMCPASLSTLWVDSNQAFSHYPKFLAQFLKSCSANLQGDGSEHRMNDGYALNRPPALSCPGCGGTLRVDGDGPVLRYICHIGHILTGEAMLVAQADRIEHQATGLLAMLNEQRELCRQLIEAKEGDQQHLEQQRSRTTRKAEIVRDFLNRSVVD
jgi:hypothetical protein